VEPIEGSAIKGRVSCSDVVEVRPNKEKGKNTFSYQLTSSVVMSLKFPVKLGDNVSLGGSISNSKMIDAQSTTDLEHLVVIGQLIEGNSDRAVAQIRGIYVSKMREILGCMRTDADFSGSLAAQELMAGAMKSA
jgi:translation initiation factor 2 gamma subunit (eIF-2gamma)